MIKYLQEVKRLNAVYYADVTPLADNELFCRWIGKLNEQRRKKIERLARPDDRLRSAGAGALLRIAVSNETGYEYEKTEFKTEKSGKGYVPGDPFFFSLSHSGKYAVCAVSDSPVGVDVEKDRLPGTISRRFAGNALEWTKKEAKGKLTGKGFFDDSPDTFVYTHKETDGFIITVCSDKKIDRFVKVDLASLPE